MHLIAHRLVSTLSTVTQPVVKGAGGRLWHWLLQWPRRRFGHSRLGRKLMYWRAAFAVPAVGVGSDAVVDGYMACFVGRVVCDSVCV